jgi:23S rRNA (uridine2552-2'-O)-methyltransferase
VNVEIEEVGDQGDGLAKVDGFAVFVSSGEPGDKLTVEIESVRRTVAHASALQGRRSATE